ncbi:centrosomal protein 43-like isoform X2 [Portunus trituberculatus]|uniref:centrosomal protein 43-like isoform X2 n=1 Tax=Portunus trituberculatus TaxID=210409 RepID=UPI001E1CFD99|nr:centrosomal protein 43-like isoform X2 [Portunus trituberculatus]
MSIEEDEDASLKELVTKTLQTNGVLGKIQKGIPLVSPPTRQVLGTHEGAVAACLVQDFLQCLGLDFSLAVFSPESGHPSLWSYPGSEALSSSLGLASGRGKRGINDDKGHSIPLLIELLREREVLPLTIQEQNGEASSISTSSSNCNREQHSVQQKKQLQDGASHSPDYLQKAPESHLWTKRDTGERHEAEEMQASPSLLPLTLENGRKRNEIILGSQKTTGLLDLPPPLESKPESDTSINGKDKQYEDDFSSMSEKYGHDDEEEVEEDIEEDLGDISADDLLNSSASGTELIPSITTPLQFLTRSTALQQLLYALKPSLPATRPYVRAY